MQNDKIVTTFRLAIDSFSFHFVSLFLSSFFFYCFWFIRWFYVPLTVPLVIVIVYYSGFVLLLPFVLLLHVEVNNVRTQWMDAELLTLLKASCNVVLDFCFFSCSLSVNCLFEYRLAVIHAGTNRIRFCSTLIFLLIFLNFNDKKIARNYLRIRKGCSYLVWFILI